MAQPTVNLATEHSMTVIACNKLATALLIIKIVISPSINITKEIVQ